MSLPHTCVDCGAIHREESCPHCLQLAPGQTWEHIPIPTVGVGRDFGHMVTFTPEELDLLQVNVGWKIKPVYSTPSAVLVVARVPKIGDSYPYNRPFRVQAVQPEQQAHDGIRGTIILSDGMGEFATKFWVPQNQATGHTADIQFDEVG